MSLDILSRTADSPSVGEQPRRRASGRCAGGRHAKRAKRRGSSRAQDFLADYKHERSSIYAFLSCLEELENETYQEGEGVSLSYMCDNVLIAVNQTTNETILDPANVSEDSEMNYRKRARPADRPHSDFNHQNAQLRRCKWSCSACPYRLLLLTYFGTMLV